MFLGWTILPIAWTKSWSFRLSSECRTMAWSRFGKFTLGIDFAAKTYEELCELVVFTVIFDIGRIKTSLRSADIFKSSVVKSSWNFQFNSFRNENQSICDKIHHIVRCVACGQAGAPGWISNNNKYVMESVKKWLICLPGDSINQLYWYLDFLKSLIHHLTRCVID